MLQEIGDDHTFVDLVIIYIILDPNPLEQFVNATRRLQNGLIIQRLQLKPPAISRRSLPFFLHLFDQVPLLLIVLLFPALLVLLDLAFLVLLVTLP